MNKSQGTNLSSLLCSEVWRSRLYLSPFRLTTGSNSHPLSGLLVNVSRMTSKWLVIFVLITFPNKSFSTSVNRSGIQTISISRGLALKRLIEPAIDILRHPIERLQAKSVARSWMSIFSSLIVSDKLCYSNGVPILSRVFQLLCDCIKYILNETRGTELLRGVIGR